MVIIEVSGPGNAYVKARRLVCVCVVSACKHCSSQCLSKLALNMHMVGRYQPGYDYITSQYHRIYYLTISSYDAAVSVVERLRLARFSFLICHVPSAAASLRNTGAIRCLQLVRWSSIDWSSDCFSGSIYIFHLSGYVSKADIREIASYLFTGRPGKLKCRVEVMVLHI